MAARHFDLNEEPHVIEIGATELLLVPEVTGPEFAEVYDALREVQIKVKNAQGTKANSKQHAKTDELGKDLLIELSGAMRSFIRSFLLDADQAAKFDAMRLPDRVLVQIMEYVAELYGGGSGNGDGGGQSSG